MRIFTLEFLAERGRFTPLVCRPASRRLALGSMARPEYSGLTHILISKMFFWFFSGGEREIRTPGILRYAPFPRVCTRPLCDLSRNELQADSIKNKGICKFLRRKFPFSQYFYILLPIILSYQRMQELFEQFFQGLGINVWIVEVIESGNDISVRLETTDSPLIIGMHGKNLEIFQHLLSRMAEKKTGQFVHLHLEVNDYMKSKDERLFRFLDSKIAFVMENGKVARIPNLNSYERKKAHNYISEKHIEWISTKSDGEGIERALFISYTGAIVVAKKSSTILTNSKTLGDDLSEDGIGI